MRKIRELYDNAAQNDKSIKKATFYNSEEIPEHFKTEVFGCGNPVGYILNDEKKKIILDIGCGAGIDLYYLSDKFSDSMIIGLDFSFDMLMRAKENIQRSDIPAFFVQADIKALPFKKEVIDIILSNACIHLVLQKERFFNESFRILSKKGSMYVSDIQTYRPWNNPFFLKEYKDTGGVFLYGGVEDKESYFDKLSNAELQYNIIKEDFFNPSAEILPTVKQKYKDLSADIEKEFRENIFILTDYIAWKGERKSIPAYVRCSCNTENVFEFFSRIPYKSLLYKRLKNNEINIVKCKKCGAYLECEDSFMITKPPHNVIFKFPEKWENIVDTMIDDMKLDETDLNITKIFKNSEFFKLIKKENLLIKFIKRLFLKKES